jgi:outer membrane protein assembly factor BamB
LTAPRFLLPLALAAGLAAGQKTADRSTLADFSFVHCSDLHVPAGVTRRTGPSGASAANGPYTGGLFGSAEVVAQIKSLTAPVLLAPYGVTAPPPAFAIATGDLTEFGGLNGWWEQYLELWKDAPFPVYHVSGNHDATWACQRCNIRRLHGQAYYSFDRCGCRFIGWDSATPQDPRPSFGEEELNWLRQDLRNLGPETPVFLFCHHPVDSIEFASLYERDRLLDLLRPYNLTLLLVGHGHNVEHRVVAGVDQVMGGSTFGAAPGYAIVAIQEGVLRVAYRRAWESAATRAVLERPLALRAHYPRIEIRSPRERRTLHAEAVEIAARIDRGGITGADWAADDVKGRGGKLFPGQDDTRGRDRMGVREYGGMGVKGSARPRISPSAATAATRHTPVRLPTHASLSPAPWRAAVDTSGWEPGAHYLRVVFHSREGDFQRTVAFYTGGGKARVRWRAFMGGSSKSTPAVEGETLYAGANDGGLYALDRRTGRERWRFMTGGEILASPLVRDGIVYFGSGDGRFYAVNRRGRPLWSFAAGGPIYSSPVWARGMLLFGANDARFYALDAETGQPRWVSSAPGYTIESRPCIAGDAVYFGAWDTFIYALNLKDGRLKWKTSGAGSAASAPGVARYYSPADAGPVVAGGKVYIADRAYVLTILDAETGAVAGTRRGVSAVGAARDGKAVYLRGTDGNLRKIDLDGQEIWSRPAHTSFLPTSPWEADGVVYSAGATGRIVALAADDGRPLWEYQATPRLYVFSDVAAQDGVAYVSGMDGSVAALEGR